MQFKEIIEQIYTVPWDKWEL